ncbi:alpha/beta fold hydrolase (plasmid) [Streptomyces sp. QH1-20]|uniref:alpha/beta fold hydrolase n=1 Tax=Streptomyces sp. QH1-20 TaxID=3240934 RepID=UPI0035137C86
MSAKITCLAVVGVLSALRVPSAASVEPNPVPVAAGVKWGQCVREDITEGVECGTLTVPVDWSRPKSGTVDLRVFRLKASDGAAGSETAQATTGAKPTMRAKGAILNFPSGPGESGDIAFASLRKDLPAYDLVSFDPRGVGESAPLTCPTDKVMKIPFVPPTDTASFNALRHNQKAFWAGCTTGDRRLDEHLDAYSTARDAEALRKALKLDKVNLYGMSYGTLMAERYLGLFGEHVNGAVLEGVMNPTQSRREFVTTAAAGTEAVFDRFRSWCAQDTGCALHGKDVAALFRTAQRNADVGGIPGGDFMGQPWTAVSVTQYIDATARDSFKEAAQGLLALSEGRNPLPKPLEGKENGQGVIAARGPAQAGEETPETLSYTDPIVCSDFDIAVPNTNQARRDLAATRAVAPVTGYSTNASLYTSICLAGPKPAKDSSLPVTTRGANQVMLLSNTHDSSTPAAWANAVAAQLGKKAVHVVTDQVGHGGGMTDPDTLRKVTTYLDHLNPGAVSAP